MFLLSQDLVRLREKKFNKQKKWKSTYHISCVQENMDTKCFAFFRGTVLNVKSTLRAKLSRNAQE